MRRQISRKRPGPSAASIVFSATKSAEPTGLRATAEPLEQRMLLSITLQSIPATVNEAGSFSFLASEFDAAFTNPGGAALADVKITTLPTHGALTVNGSAASINQIVARGSLSTLAFTPTTA